MASLTAILLLFGTAQVAAQSSQSVLQAIEQEVIDLVRQVEPSIVSVITQRSVINAVNGQSFIRREYAIGSGVVIHSDGYILTTSNVVEGADRIMVNFPDGQRRDGRLVGSDPLSEIAVIHVDSVTVMPVQMGDSDEIYPGAWAIMMGNAFDLPSSVSFGLVNGIRYDGLLQISALVTPGSTGGAVFSTDAKVIGLIAAELTHAPEPNVISYEDGISRGNANVLKPSLSGAVLVVPINRVKSFAHQLIEYGEVRRSWLGVQVEQSWIGINTGGNIIGFGITDGMYIEYVHEKSPAEQADLRVGDRIVAVNGIPMAHPLRLAEYVTTIPIGSEIEIKYVRDNQEAVTYARLTQRPEIVESSPAIETDLPGIPVNNDLLDTQFPLTPRMLNQWLMELQIEIQRLKKEHLNEQIRLER